MNAHWKFNTVRPGDRTRESQVEKFFSSQDERATPLIREGIQNSLDADPDDRQIRVRLTLGRYNKAETRELWTRYAADLIPHLDAIGDKLPDAPGTGDSMRYLVFEDFETSGLRGDPDQWELIEGRKNGFFEFFRAEGVSTKEGSSRGRHGVGKFVFMAASRVRTIFGLTRRDDGRELLMGTTVLRHHHVGKAHFMPDGFFGIADPKQDLNVLPVEDVGDVSQFKAAFRLSRKDETGLSIVVPWLHDEVKRESLIKAVVEGYFFPLMEKGLSVEIVDEEGSVTRIDNTSLRSVIHEFGAEYEKKISQRLDLAATAIAANKPIALLPPEERHSPKWSDACFPEDALQAIRRRLSDGELISIQCPTRVTLKKDGAAQPGLFTVYLRKDPLAHDYDVQFIRQGILVSEVKTRRIPGLRGLVVIRDGPLATFLGDAENPAHTEWQSDRVRHYSFNKASIEYVTTSIEEIIRRTQADDSVPDPLPLRDLFFLPSEPNGPKLPQKSKKQKSGREPDDNVIKVKPKPKSYAISKVDGGFIVRRGRPGTAKPDSIEIRMAYDTHKGNPFAKYNPADFRLDGKGILVESVGTDIREYDTNRICADILSDEFEIKVTGFDVNRDVIVKAKAQTANAEEETGEADDAETV